jgi:hypothetical protein
MRKWFLALLLLCCAPLAHGATYYICQATGSPCNASDSNAGTSKTATWLHAPYMTGATGNAASYSCNPGDTFILRGGDTWSVVFTSGIWWNWQCGGTSGSHITITRDVTWYAGGSWTRPILNGGGTSPGTMPTSGSNIGFFQPTVNYVDTSWLEFTGMYWQGLAGGGSVDVFYVGANFSNNTFSNIYLHGWTHGPCTPSGGNCTNTIDLGYGFFGQTSGSYDGTSVTYSVCDGSDTAEDSFNCTYGGGGYAYDVFNEYMSVQVVGVSFVHDNLFENSVNSFTDACTGTCNLSAHPNTMEDDGSCNAVFYNNVVRNTSSGSEPFYIGPHASCAAYVFNNVLSQIGSPNMITFGADALGASGTIHNAWNNTVEGGLDSDPPGYNCFNVSSSTYVASATMQNNFCATTAALNNSPAGVTITTTTNLTKTLSAWNGLSYTSSQTYVFSPVSSGSTTIGAGTSVASLCSTVNGINAAAGTACLLGTTYGPAYNATTHTVTASTLTTNARTTPDVGAYQGVPGGSIVPPPGPSPIIPFAMLMARVQ